MPIFNVLIIAILGGALFSFLHIPIPWMLGPLVFVLCSQFVIRELKWPKAFRNVGLIIVSVTIGEAFVVELFLQPQMLELSLYLIGLNIALLCFAFFMSFMLQKWTGQTFMNAVVCSVPGGLSQIVTFAEEQKNIDLAVVTYFHVVRVLAVVVVIPFIISPHSVAATPIPWQLGEVPALLLLLLCSALCVPIARKLRIPTPQILGPVLFVIVLKLFHVELPLLPTTLQQLAQLLVGAYIGLLLKPPMLKLAPRMLIAGVASAAVLLIVTYGGAHILMHQLDYSFATAILATAPGGLDQMGILAAAVGANISIVTLFQLVRILFIFFVAMPLVQLLNRKYS